MACVIAGWGEARWRSYPSELSLFDDGGVIPLLSCAALLTYGVLVLAYSNAVVHYGCLARGGQVSTGGRSALAS